MASKLDLPRAGKSSPQESTKYMRVLLCLGLALGAVGHSHRKRHHQLAALEAHDDLPTFEDLMLERDDGAPAERREARHAPGDNGDGLDNDEWRMDYTEWSNMGVCLDSARGGGAVLGEAAAVMASFADKQTGRIRALLKAGAPLHRSYLGNAQLLQTAIYHIVWTIGTVTMSTHFQMLSKVTHRTQAPPPSGRPSPVIARQALDVMSQYVHYKLTALSANDGEVPSPATLTSPLHPAAWISCVACAFRDATTCRADWYARDP